LRSHWEHDIKNGTPAGTRIDFNPPFVQLDDPPRQGKPQPETGDLVPLFGTVKRLEDILLFFGGNASSFVLYRDADLFAMNG
jgi:hypothetical protein